MPRQSKTKRTLARKYLRRSEFIADFQRIHPYLHSNFAVFLQRIAAVLAFLTFVIGNTSLVSAVFQSQFKINSLSLLITRPVVAVVFIFLSLGALFALTRRKNIAVHIVIYFFAGLALLISITSLLFLIPFSQSLLIHLLPLFSQAQFMYMLSYAPNGALILLFLSLSLIFSQKPSHIVLGQSAAIIGILILFPTDIGYLYGSDFIYNFASSTKLSGISTVGLNAISLALLFLRADLGIMRGLTGSTTGAFFARRFVFLAIIAPIVLGWVDLAGYYVHWYNVQVRFLLLITSSILTLLIWAVFIARSLQTLDTVRRRTQENIIFLADASKILSSSLDYHLTLKRIALLAVPSFADWCTVEMVNEKHEVKQLTIAHRNNRQKAIASRLLKNKNLYQDTSAGLHHVLQTGKAELYPHITTEMLIKSVRDKKNLQTLQKLGIHSAMIVPITIHRQTVGAIQFVLSSSIRFYTTSDLQIAQELTARAALAIENAMLYKNAQNAIKIRDEFISVASHELKTPLTSLKVYTEVLLKKFEKKDGKTAGYLQKMDDQISNLTSLIKDLLDVTRIQVGKLAFHFERVDIKNLVQDIVANFQPTTKHKITIEGTISQLIIADRERVSQVVLNLLTNAVKYSPNANSVHITLSQTKTSVQVSVKDFGIGLDKKNLDRIFERFYQVGNKRRTNVGLGMGLYISNEIVTRHGGTITVQSTKGKGATFTFVLPIKPPNLTS